MNTPCMGTYPKQCCHFGVLIASYGDDDEDEDEDEDDEQSGKIIENQLKTLIVM